MVKEQTVESFLQDLSSKKPVPGGGGASALAGAVGTALSLMVIALTVGKKKYQDTEELLLQKKTELEELQERFLILADRDEEVFLPLSKAYALPKETEEEKKARRKVLQNALLDATEVPLEIMEAAVQALECTKTVAECGSSLAISDAGVAASYLRTAIEGAMFNVRINLKSLRPGEQFDAFEKRAGQSEAGLRLASEVEETVRQRLDH